MFHKEWGALKKSNNTYDGVESVDETTFVRYHANHKNCVAKKKKREEKEKDKPTLRILGKRKRAKVTDEAIVDIEKENA